MAIINSKVQSKLKEIVQKLIEGNFGGMEAEGLIPPNTAQGFYETIEHAERTAGKLTTPPEEAFSDVLEFLELPPLKAGEKRWWLVFDLWLGGEHSDFKLEGEYLEDEAGEGKIFISQLVW